MATRRLGPDNSHGGIAIYWQRSISIPCYFSVKVIPAIRPGKLRGDAADISVVHCLPGVDFRGGLFFVRKHPIARWAVGGIIITLTTGRVFWGILGLPMLGGRVALWHLVTWPPALVLLLTCQLIYDPAEGR